jgi:hypothetical protein
LAVVRPCWKFRVELTGRAPADGYTWSQPLPPGWLAMTLRASALTFGEAGIPLAPEAPVAVKVVVPPAARLTLLTTVDGGTGTYLAPVTPAAALVYQPRSRTRTLVAAVARMEIWPPEETGTISKPAVVRPRW